MTLAELQGLFADAGLLAKVQAACVIKAEGIRTEPLATANHAANVAWARAALADPAAVAPGILRGVLAQNPNLSVAQMQSASDANIQGAVNNAINLFVM